ncbi:tryptophan 7-halogenase [Methylorubrum populi]|uniref:Tryptophan halogenase n=1 Tax=Methylorubrum populi TaxID=223967 RepID=A0A833J4K8_9HYPH|nr:tryptophan 7-halogenase [Methylorubrum populi]KAB7784387.1 Tryptophan halogenase [Methylorubrum populi]
MLRSERSVPPRLVIAGGGPAGSIAAAYLRRILRRAGWSVTLVAPEPAAGPSVALATRPAFTRFRQGFDIDEPIFLRRCAGTYRLASRFEDWFAGGRGHWHPFGACGPRIAGRDLFHYWLKLCESGARREAGDYADYAPQTLMAAEGRGPRPQAGTSSLVQSGDYGYHLDRAGLVRVFREIALSEGVRAVPGRVRGIERDPYGDVAALLLDGGERIEGDVFLDCTGAAAQLVGAALGEPWIAEGGAGDRIAYLSTAREPEPAPFTLYRGRPEGWVAALPLAGRSDHAFVYDGRTTPPETAQALLRAASGCENGTGGVCDAELRCGRRRAPWQRNVVAVGAAAGAVEPLMGFGLDLVLAALEAFVAYLPRGGRAAEVLRRAYAARMNRLHDDAEQAVAAHYVLGRRPEPFWAAARAAAVPERLADRLDLYELAGHVEPEADAVFGEGDHYLLFAGADFLPRRPFAPVDVGDGREIERLLAGVRARSAQVAQTMAPHSVLLEGLHGRAPAGSTVQVAAAAKDSAARHGPQSLRRSPEGARLADLVASLGQPFGYERSVKATPAGLQTERFLVQPPPHQSRPRPRQDPRCPRRSARTARTGAVGGRRPDRGRRPAPSRLRGRPLGRALQALRRMVGAGRRGVARDRRGRRRGRGANPRSSRLQVAGGGIGAAGGDALPLAAGAHARRDRGAARTPRRILGRGGHIPARHGPGHPPAGAGARARRGPLSRSPGGTGAAPLLRPQPLRLRSDDGRGGDGDRSGHR